MTSMLNYGNRLYKWWKSGLFDRVPYVIWVKTDESQVGFYPGEYVMLGGTKGHLVK